MLIDPEDAQPSSDLPVSQGLGTARYRFPLEFLPNIKVAQTSDYLIKGLLPSGALSALYGRPGSGKSFLALDAALHVAAGRPWAGCKVRSGGVVYIASEAGRGMRKRIRAAVGHHAMHDGLPFALLTVAPDLGQRENDADRLAEEILAQVPNGFSPRLIVLDTLARSMVGGDESGSAGMSLFIDNAERLGKHLGAAVLAVHHMGKDTARGLRGSSALLGAVEALWELDPERRGFMRVAKMKDDQDDLAVQFKLTRTVVGIDRDGDSITTCVVDIDSVSMVSQEPAEEGAGGLQEGANEQQADNLTPSTEAFLSLFEQLIEQEGTLYRRSRHVPADVKTLVQRDLVDHAAALAVHSEAPKSRRSQIDRHVRMLVDRERIMRHEGRLWLPRPIS